MFYGIFAIQYIWRDPGPRRQKLVRKVERATLIYPRYFFVHKELVQAADNKYHPLLL